MWATKMQLHDNTWLSYTKTIHMPETEQHSPNYSQFLTKISWIPDYCALDKWYTLLGNIIMPTHLLQEMKQMHSHALQYVNKVDHTSPCVVEGAWFSPLVLHSVGRSGMRWSCTAIIWVRAIRGGHWPATASWSTSTVSLVRPPWVLTIISQVWATLLHKS